MVLAVCPEVLHRIQFRRVWRQVLYIQAAFLIPDECMGELAFVSRKPVPNQQNVALDIAEQVLEKLDHLLGFDGFLEDLKIKTPRRQASDDRQCLPIEVKLQDRRLPTRRPGTPPMRPLAQTTFVDEDIGDNGVIRAWRAGSARCRQCYPHPKYLPRGPGRVWRQGLPPIDAGFQSNLAGVNLLA